MVLFEKQVHLQKEVGAVETKMSDRVTWNGRGQLTGRKDARSEG